MEITNYEGVSYRDDRLRKAARIASAILGLSPKQLDRLVMRVHDHKGELTVYWLDEPTDAGKLAFTAAWTECGEHSVRHGVVAS